MADLRSTLRDAVDDLVPSGDEWERTLGRARRRRRRSRALAVITAIAVATAGLGIAYRAFSGSPAEELGGICVSGWDSTEVPNPGNVQNGLVAVASLSANDAWAVGSATIEPQAYLDRSPPPPGSLGGPAPPTLNLPVALHWDGASWHQMQVPNPDVHQEAFGDVGGARLQDVAAPSPNDVWVVGGGQRPLIEHWNGRHWAILPSPRVNLVDETFEAVAATGPADAWAIGSGGLHGGIGPVIEHWDGVRWSFSTTPDVGHRYSTLADVAALSPDDAWAVGQAWNGPLALHWNGSSWSRVPVPNLRAVRLDGVAPVGPNDAWAVGTDYRDLDGRAPAHAVLYHWDGTRWILVRSPFPADKQSYLGDVSAADATDVWARGGIQGGTGDLTVQTLVHFDGHAWSVVRGPTPGPSTMEYSGISARGHGSVWLVGAIERRINPTTRAFAGLGCRG